MDAKYIVLDIGRIPLEIYNSTHDSLILSLIALEKASNMTETKVTVERAVNAIKGTNG